MTDLHVVRASDLAFRELPPRPTFAAEVARAREISDAWSSLRPRIKAGPGIQLNQPVYWRGRQWAVTRYGIECLRKPYEISSDRLWEGEERRGWVGHMLLKTWIDGDDFVEALRVARCLAEMQRQGTLSKPFFAWKRLPPPASDYGVTASPFSRSLGEP